MVVGFFFFNKLNTAVQWRKEAFQQMELKQPSIHMVKNEPQLLLDSKYENQFKTTHRPHCENQTTKTTRRRHRQISV